MQTRKKEIGPHLTEIEKGYTDIQLPHRVEEIPFTDRNSFPKQSTGNPARNSHPRAPFLFRYISVSGYGGVAQAAIPDSVDDIRNFQTSFAKLTTVPTWRSVTNKLWRNLQMSPYLSSSLWLCFTYRYKLKYKVESTNFIDCLAAITG